MKVSITLKAEETAEVDMDPASVVVLLAQIQERVAWAAIAWRGMDPAQRKGGLVSGGQLAVRGVPVGEWVLEIDE